MRSLTSKQQQILNFVSRYCREREFPPTLREIGEAVGPANISAVRGHLAALQKKGFITKDPDKARSIRIVRSSSVLSSFKHKLHQLAGMDRNVLYRVAYGIVLVTRKRRKHFVGNRREWIEAALDRQAVEHGWTLLHKRVGGDHLVFVAEVWPTHSPHAVAHRVRRACNAVRRRHLKDFPGRRLWAPGFAVTTDLGRLDEMAERFLNEVPAEK